MATRVASKCHSARPPPAPSISPRASRATGGGVVGTIQIGGRRNNGRKKERGTRGKATSRERLRDAI
jgi:hypothetical protein